MDIKLLIQKMANASTEEVRVEVEIAKISKYISLSSIAKDYLERMRETLQVKY